MLTTVLTTPSRIIFAPGPDSGAASEAEAAATAAPAAGGSGASSPTAELGLQRDPRAALLRRQLELQEQQQQEQPQQVQQQQLVPIDMSGGAAFEAGRAKAAASSAAKGKLFKMSTFVPPPPLEGER
jgi:hypothetical protein